MASMPIVGIPRVSAMERISMDGICNDHSMGICDEPQHQTVQQEIVDIPVTVEQPMHGIGEEHSKARTLDLSTKNRGEFHISFGGSWDKAHDWFRDMFMLERGGGRSGILGRIFAPYVAPQQQPIMPQQQHPQPLQQVVEPVQVPFICNSIGIICGIFFLQVIKVQPAKIVVTSPS